MIKKLVVCLHFALADSFSPRASVQHHAQVVETLLRSTAHLTDVKDTDSSYPWVPIASSDERTRKSEERRFLLSMLALAVGGSAWSFPHPTIAKDLGEEYRQGTAALSESDETAPVPREAYKKLESGVIYADLRLGQPNDQAVGQGSKVNLQWVLRKSNGYFVDSSATHDSVPFIFTVGDGTAIRGLDEAVRGMREGGVRRILMPPSLAYVDGLDDGMPGPLPHGYGPRQQMRRVQKIRKDVPGEYVYLEVQVTRVR
jgi:hypothetical protein